jgi:type III pantothenate kinase
MNLVIDIGNTLAKAAIFDHDKLKFFYSYTLLDEKTFISLLSKHNEINSIIVSSVTQQNLGFEKYLEGQKYFELNSTTRLPIINLYKTPETLGKDRLSAAVGANSIFENANVLSIDAGTCIKYDFVNDKNEYLGGAISPGLQMRFKALKDYTQLLPLVEPENRIQLIGDTTQTSILSGVVNGMVAEIENIIQQYQLKYKDLKLILTGGDSDFFAKELKSSIFAEPYLILIGLNRILNYNLQH